MGPLDGIRIIDLTSMLSGPWATMILADQGANVIKVEEPRQGDHTRSYGNKRNGFSASFLNLNRNKRSVAIDLKTAKGVELVKRLAAGADVLVQNFRPGVVERLGVDEGAIRAVSPGIVYVSINGFGEKGPYAKKPVYDPIVQAFSGLTTVQAGSDAQRPRLIRTVLPDKLTAVTAAQAIAAALVGRLKTGKGQHVRLSMLDAVLAFLWASDMGAQTYVGEKVSQRAAASFIDLIYETKNGFMTSAVMTNKEWAALTRALGHPEWLEDPRFTTPALRDQNIDARLQMTQDVLKTLTTEEWLERLEAEQVPCAPVLTRDQVIAHPQIAASGYSTLSVQAWNKNPVDTHDFAVNATRVAGAHSMRFGLTIGHGDGRSVRFQLDRQKGRIFVNEPGAFRVAVLDRKSGSELARWGASGAAANFRPALRAIR
jgi:crotonobetainyl-CoA:carnitine CoA-transferase CaiB-like acyl-CoA transferase